MSIPSSGRDLVARLGEPPALPQIDVGATMDPAPGIVVEADLRGLDEIVANCLEQLRQVMDDLQ